MTKTQKTKTLTLPAAQSRAEAEAAIAEIGLHQRALARIEADLADLVARATAEAEATADPLKAQIAANHARVLAWAQANRSDLTGNGKTKTVELATGTISWRIRPPKVTVTGAKAVLEVLLAGGAKLKKFVRTKHSIDRQALKKDPDLAATVPGIKVGSAGEDFVIEPVGAELAQAVKP